MEASDRPLAIDLFSGAGGLSLGLEAAGYRVALAVDIDEWALETQAHNFEGLALRLDLAVRDVRDWIVALFDGVDVDLIAGGPPCQPYSRAGRSKIRSLVEEGVRDSLDHRRELWRSFLDVVERIRPRAVLMENVPDMALGDDTVVLRRMVGSLEASGYETDARLVDAWAHGVPQHRQRLVLIGLRDGGVLRWPEAVEQVTLREAIGDLPILDPERGDVGEVELPYDRPRSEFQRKARKRCVGQAAKVVLDHWTRPVRPDDVEAFRLMRPGTLYSDLPDELRRYRADIFDDKYNRLAWDDLSRSITAHIAKDGYWYIHPEQHRTLTVREAARLQTFPDDFRFAGTRSHQFAQIGNAVPPTLAEAIGVAILDAAGSPSRSHGSSMSRWRSDFRSRLERWATRDRAIAPWAYPGDLWVTVVGQLMSGRGDVGWPDPDDVLALVPSWNEATPSMLAALETMADPGRRCKAVQRLTRLAESVRGSPNGWDGEDWLRSAGVAPASREWIELLGLSRGMVASTSVLRVTARVTASEVDRQNKSSDGRMELAKLIGDGELSGVVNAAMHRLGTMVCTPDHPDCKHCPVVRLCASARC
jgi:DNA (cytosine-5)-methyltransferase 1